MYFFLNIKLHLKKKKDKAFKIPILDTVVRSTVNQKKKEERERKPCIPF